MAALAEQESFSLEEQVREANRLFKEEKLEDALAMLAPITSDEAVYLPARFLLAMVAWKMDMIDRAIELMRDCHEKWPMDGTVAEVLASLYAQVGNLSESRFMGKLATALGGYGGLTELVAPGFPVFDAVFYNIKETPLLTQAKVGLATGNLGYAIEKARQHSALNPEDGDAHAFHAALLLRAGAASVAAEVLREVEGSMAEREEFPAAYASLYAQALTGVGEFGDARKWHAKAKAAAPKDATIAAAYLADALWLEEKPAALVTAGEDWARQFCPPAKPQQLQRSDGRLVIGYIVAALSDPHDIAAVAAVARAHDRKRVTVVGYGAGDQSWEANSPYGGAFDIWQDISKLDPSTLARFFSRDGLNVVVDAAGFAAPGCLLALAQSQTALRISWLGNPVNLRSPVYDYGIAAKSSANRGKSLWRIGRYPLLRQSPRQASRPSRDWLNFGADVQLAQLDKKTVKLWSKVLKGRPDAKLLLRGNDLRASPNIDRLVARFGNELAARIDIVTVDQTEEFYETADIVLLPRRGISARAAADALRQGIPAIALAGREFMSPYADFLRDLGLGPALVAADENDYVRIALGLTTTDESRAEIASRIVEAFSDCSAQNFARSLEEHAKDAMKTAESVSS
jgi:tetratricopeptide (TPR) repeat protein